MRFSFAFWPTTGSKVEQEVPAVLDGPFLFHSVERVEADDLRNPPTA